jgi:hypothetical protein
MSQSVKGFSISKNTTAIDILLLKIKVYVVFQPYTLECRAAICMEIKLTFIKQIYPST